MKYPFACIGLLICLTTPRIAVPTWGQSPAPPATTPPTETAVSDAAPSWIWDRMYSADLSTPSQPSSHAGGPGGSGTYIFTGTRVTIFGYSNPVISVNNTEHHAGKIRVTIDGVNEGEFSESAIGQSVPSPIFTLKNLPAGNHSLIVQPVGGWANISSITIETQVKTSATTTGDIYTLTCQKSGYLLGDPAGSTTEYTSVTQEAANGAKYQNWKVVPLGNQLYEIKNEASGLALASTGPTNTSVVVVATYAPVAAFQWRMVSNGDGYYKIYNMASGLYLDNRGSTDPDSNLTQWSFFDSPNIAWKFTKQ